jgi:hypothetical protein
MSGSMCHIDDRVPALKQSVRDKGERVIKEVKKVQRSFWSLN